MQWGAKLTTSPALDGLHELPGFRQTGQDQYEARCPGHDDQTPSLSIGIGEDGRILLDCKAGCKTESILDALGLKMGDLFPHNGNGHGAPDHVPSWQRIWSETIPLDSTAAEPSRRYFANRGLNLKVFPADVRFHASLEYFNDQQTKVSEHPALIFLVRNAHKVPIGVQRIYLTKDGRKADVPTPKKALGPISGGAIYLGDYQESLNVAEGPETALAVWTASGLPTCSTVSAAGMSKFQIPDSIRTVDIWADKDRSGAGQKAADELAGRAHRAGKTVYLRLPGEPIPEGVKSRDWLDLLNSEGFEPFQHELERGEPWTPELRDKPSEFHPPAHWKLLDGAKVKAWTCADLVWIIERVFARGNLLILAAQTQTGKTLVGIYIALSMLRGGLLFGKFKINPIQKLLYLVLEDPPRRIKARIEDMIREGDSPIEPSRFILYFAPGFKLNDDACFGHLEELIGREAFEVVVIDTWQKATPGLASYKDEDQSLILHRIADLTRKYDVALWINDHFRKADNGKTRRVPTVDDIKGTGAKAQNADAFLLMDRDGSRLRIKGSSKDSDKPIGFLLEVAPEGGQDRAKFTYAGELEDMAAQSTERGNATKTAIFEAMQGAGWISCSDIATKIKKSESTVRGHLSKLVKDGKVEETGEKRWKRYRRIDEQQNSAISSDTVNRQASTTSIANEQLTLDKSTRVGVADAAIKEHPHTQGNSINGNYDPPLGTGDSDSDRKTAH